jgi:hypothetical protein
MAVRRCTWSHMSEPKIRDLRVTDIRCRCGAGPGQSCIRPSPLPHRHRVREHAELVAAGWKWQEVDPRDAGARG